MQTEKQRLLSMLSENKINQHEYQILLKALNRRCFFEKLANAIWLNPFRKIAGLKALLIGCLLLACMALVGVQAKLYYPGLFTVLNASVIKAQSQPLSFTLLCYQLGISSLCLALLCYSAAKIAGQKGLRLIDFLGSCALARYPSLALAGLLFFVRKYNPGLLEPKLSQGISMQPSLSMSLLTACILGLFIWQLSSYYYALRESSGLKNQRLTLSFILCLGLAELISSPLSSFFMN